MPKIRAASTLKIATDRTNLDWTYSKGTRLLTIVEDVLPMIIREEGLEAVETAITRAKNVVESGEKTLGAIA